MSKAIRILKYALIIVLVLLFTGCATSKNPYYQKRKKTSQINTTQLGRNKYFFSPTYQKKLKANYKNR